MKTIKEQYAPYFQELARWRRERRFYEACSIPWFHFEWQDKGEEGRKLSHEEAEQMKASGELVPLTEKDFALPFERFVVVAQISGSVALLLIDSTTTEQWFGMLSGGEWRGWARADLNEKSHECSAVLVLWSKFSRRFFDPGTHVVAIRPVNAMKSVEWIRSQEHYVFLTQSAALKDDSQDTGQRGEGKEGEDRIIKRMAHWVRAHERVLRSPRFRFKQGQTVPVKQQWRGPKEWADKRSRQVYRWVDKLTLTSGKEDHEAAAA
jgi:hypothetical protein